MGHCNLKMTDDCYGCAYYGTGDIAGCKLTIQYYKEHMEDKGISYPEWMSSQSRMSNNDMDVENFTQTFNKQ